jgi:P63C domain
MDEDFHSRGGKARALNSSDEERIAQARKAAVARWNSDIDVSKLPSPLAAADLDIGGIKIPCAIVDVDGVTVRVLSERGIAGALGRTRSGSHWQKNREQGAKMPVYLSAENILPFISNRLIEALSSPIWYRAPNGGRPVAGVPADCLVEVCDVWVQAEAAGKLAVSQIKFAHQARILMKGLGTLGIIGLIDEATGYQEVRSKTELQRILSAYISDALLPWSQRFPMTYYKEMFRLWGWQWPPRSGIQGPRYAGKLTKKIVYEKLPPGVLDELERVNPPDENWQRKFRHPQHLTDGIGQPHLEKQVAVVTSLMTVCDDKDEFMRKFERAFPGTFAKGRQEVFDFKENKNA